MKGARVRLFFSNKPACFYVSLFFLCVFYLIYECIFNHFDALSADEFVFARHIFEYTFHVPYRDFPPYKTVLGYYLLSLPFYFSSVNLSHFYQPIFYIKDEIALINTIFIFLSAVLLKQFFGKKTVFFAVILILANQLFLLYSSDLRVDMLTSWLGLFAVIFFLRNQASIAGLLLGAAFLISQKALWFLCAMNGAWLISCLLSYHTFAKIRPLLIVNFAATFVVLVYVLVWSIVASPHEVIANLFYEAYIQAKITWYLPLYFPCWQAVLSHGPILFFLWPFTIIAFAKARTSAREDYAKRIFIQCFAAISLLLFIQYKQPFPYNFVFTVPAFLLLYADFISYLFAANSQPDAQKRFSPVILVGILLYSLLILTLTRLLHLAPIYYLIALLPLGIYCYLQTIHKNFLYYFSLGLIIIITIITGIVVPFYFSYHINQSLDGRYQQTMLKITANLLQNDESYLGGIPFFYQKDQSVVGLKNLIGPAIDYLSQPNAQLKLLLLPSLYLTPTSIDEVLQDLNRQPVKVILNNYRMLSLPAPIKTYIEQNYQHFYGSIYLYAPIVAANQLNFYVKFSGNYQLESIRKVTIDGKKFHPQQLIYLGKGDHLAFAHHAYRLRFVPAIATASLNPRYQQDSWFAMLKAILN